ncbi:hypothetical protein TNCT_667361 [Trichonephila clavata]|uniref:Uncharacterized protein n=1 Tax=Trichonephila clavata TaxID=2740835 RepID=A0A8X6LVY4_TRICU|nr:hypothetical protein TNCT_667361 [Trichonephila clavata]
MPGILSTLAAVANIRATRSLSESSGEQDSSDVNNRGSIRILRWLRDWYHAQNVAFRNRNGNRGLRSENKIE